jgi:pimeloyl-ACP methyl ester carboxylesterase
MMFNHKAGRSVEIDGAAIYYEVTGSDDAAPPLLLLHGGMGSVEDFNVLLPALSAHFRVIGIDSRGHGRSTLGDCELTYQRLEGDVIGVLRHLDIGQTAILGFSDGGIVGYRLMASEAVAVTKLATIGAPCELKADDPVRAIYTKVTGESWRIKFPASYESYQRLNPEPDFGRLVTSSVHMWLDSTPSGYPAEVVDRLKGEVLILRGDDDHLFTRQAAVDLANQIKRSVFANIPFAGHAAHEDQPDIVLHSVVEFLRRTAAIADVMRGRTT